MSAPMPVVRVVCLSVNGPAASLLQEGLATFLPGALVELADASIVRSLPDADLAVIDAVDDASRGIDLLRQLRARGYGRIAIVVLSARSESADIEAARLGAARCVPISELDRELPRAVTEALAIEAALSASPALAELARVVRNGQRLISAGEIAMGLQHSLNNPLAALLAEAQMLEFEPLEPEHLESVERIVELCRRVINVTRSLEGIAGPK